MILTHEGPLFKCWNGHENETAPKMKRLSPRKGNGSGHERRGGGSGSNHERATDPRLRNTYKIVSFMRPLSNNKGW